MRGLIWLLSENKGLSFEEAARQEILQTVSQIGWLSIPEVQHELALSEDQLQDVADLAASVRRQFIGLIDACEEERHKRVLQNWLPAARRLEARLLELLTPYQHWQLEEITMQKWRDAAALQEPASRR